jgi:hypothetical protein
MLDDFKRYIWEDRTLAIIAVATLVGLIICLTVMIVMFGWAGVAVAGAIVAGSAGATIVGHILINR